MKIFISTPMSGRTQEAIRRYRETQKRVAEAVLGEEVEVLDSISLDDTPKGPGKSIYYLGEAIRIMSDADIIVAPNESIARIYRGCRIEMQIAREYDMRIIELPFLPEDDEIFEERKKKSEEDDLKRMNRMRQLNNLPELEELPEDVKGYCGVW